MMNDKDKGLKPEIKKGCSINCFGTFSSILQALFICMKLGLGGPNQIMEWGWWWVFCPMWIGFVVAVVILFLWAILNATIKALE